jgi:antitoxin component YwqK of YwqJK toxin-antitoxin module
MKPFLIFFFFFFSFLYSFCQEENKKFYLISKLEMVYSCYYNKDFDYIDCVTSLKTDSTTIIQGAYEKIKNNFTFEDGKYVNGDFAYFIRYHDNGRVSKIVNFLNDSIHEQALFYEDGGIHSTGLFLYSRKYGHWNYYHSNGKLLKTEEYKVMQIYDDEWLYNRKGYRDGLFASVKNGVWQYYDSEGRLQRTEFYIDDFLVNFLEYNNKGNVIREAEGVFDICTEFYPKLPCTTFAEPIDGFIKYFDPITGMLLKTEYFENGVLTITAFESKRKKNKH